MKKIDAIISSLSIIEKRQQEIAFTDKRYAANSRLIAPKGSKLLGLLDALMGKSNGVLQGTTQETFANAMWPPRGVCAKTAPTTNSRKNFDFDVYGG